MLAGLTLLVAAAMALSAESQTRTNAFVIHPDGSIVAWMEVGSASSTGRRSGPVRLAFGMPRRPPERRWRENDTLPICHTEWEQTGIRYTQTVLLTRLAKGELPTLDKPAGDSVLLVQLRGDSVTNVYTEATAALSARRDEQSLRLEFRDGLVCLAGTNPAGLLALLDVSSSGIAATNGLELRFQGNMPPGTSGTMTLKFPVAQLKGEPDLERLRDLEFDEELQRVKRFWSQRDRNDAAPVTFSK